MPESSVETALLVTSELMTNAVVHALPPTALHLHFDRPIGLRVEVSDGGPRQAPRTPGPEDEHGRGLDIVAAVCTRHGTYTHAQGATHWAEVGA